MGWYLVDPFTLVRGSARAWADCHQFRRVEQSHKIAMMCLALYKAFFRQSQIQSRSLSGYVMVCQVFSAFWNTIIGRNNHFNHKQTRDL
jgi:hypothetical protein